ncbi:MAG: aminotransferase class I/II-fold pyridoxal phosphate-dependent enzyme [Spirochaetaceae bacterium]|jgi:O-acetylhomoserine (thiol)-lyase|nr:aminotransferase class I/II-fold pyridoxal phosphate-dependent enzyme [Spirochaetaceae bacterium]
MSYEAYCDDSLGFTTKQLHAGYNPSEHYRSKAVPVYQSVSFELGDYERCLRIYEQAQEAYSYSRSLNPTTAVLERRMAALEGASGALALGSGMAAIANTFLNLASAGDNIVAVKTLYGGTTTLLQHILPQYSITGRFVENPQDIDSYEKAITDKTKALFIESLGNPALNIVDIEAVAALAHRYALPLIVDNTFATPYLLRPFEFGADIVCYSATKYLGGHGIALAGLVLEKGGFNWFSGRFPYFESFYHEYKDRLPDLAETLFIKRMRMVYLSDMGAHLSPSSAFSILQGIETLSLRMERHVTNAKQIALFLSGHPAVSEVLYPTLPTSPYHDLADKYFKKGAGAMLSIRLAGGKSAALAVLERLRIFDFMVNMGDAKSMIVHPASSTHSGQPEAEQHAAGVFADTLRLSIGIEDTEDLIQDLRQALEMR